MTDNDLQKPEDIKAKQASQKERDEEKEQIKEIEEIGGKAKIVSPPSLEKIKIIGTE